MRRIIFLLLVSAASANAQQKSEFYQSAKDSAIQPSVMAHKFAAIKGKNPATLIPFKQNDRWGFLDKKV